MPAPPEGLGLAINSVAGRTQNLLHIHISCVLPEVARGAGGGADRARLGGGAVPDARGAAFNVRKVARLEPSPFLLLRELPGAAEDMGDQSLGVIGGADGGFFMLTNSTEPGVVAETEALLDETCRG